MTTDRLAALLDVLREANNVIENNYGPDPTLVYDVKRWQKFQRAVNRANDLIAAGVTVAPQPAEASQPDTLRRAVVAAAAIFLAAHDRVIESDPVTRDDTFAMKNAADNLRDVLREYNAEEAGRAR